MEMVTITTRGLSYSRNSVKCLSKRQPRRTIQSKMKLVVLVTKLCTRYESNVILELRRKKHKFIPELAHLKGCLVLFEIHRNRRWNSKGYGRRKLIQKIFRPLCGSHILATLLEQRTIKTIRFGPKDNGLRTVSDSWPSGVRPQSWNLN